MRIYEGTAEELAEYEKAKLNTECTVKLSLDTLSAENATKGFNSFYQADELPKLQTMANEDLLNSQIKFR